MVEDAARTWLEGDCLTSDLLRGPRLVGALHLLEDEPDLLDDTAHEFLDASRDASLDEAQRARVDAARERRTSRRLRTLLASALVLLVLSGVGGGVALRSRTLAEQARVESLAASLGAQALVERRPDRALLLATEAVKLSPGSRTELALLTTLQRVARALTVTNLGARTVTSALSPNGRVLAVASNVGDLWLLDADTLAVRAKLRDADGRTMPRVLFLSDRELLYVVNNKDAVVGSDLLVRDVSTQEERLVARLDDVWRLEASPDRSLLTATAALAAATLTRRPDGTYAVQTLPLTKNLTNVATDGSYARLDIATGRLDVVRPAARKAAGPAGSAAAGGSVVSSVSAVPIGTSVELSPDGRTFAVADNANGTIHLLDPATGRRLGDLAGEPGFAEDLAFSPDGRLLAAGGTPAPSPSGTSLPAPGPRPSPPVRRSSRCSSPQTEPSSTRRRWTARTPGGTRPGGAASAPPRACPCPPRTTTGTSCASPGRCLLSCRRTAPSSPSAATAWSCSTPPRSPSAPDA